jgi:arginase
MDNRYLLTPSFIGDPVPGLLPLAEAGWQVNDPSLPQGPPEVRMSILHGSIAGFVATAISEGTRPVSVAGDCCSAIGVHAGLQRAGVTPTLLWFDAHGDFNTRQTTPSGFLGGMPLAMIVGRGDQEMLDAVDAVPLAEDGVVLTDGRDLDPLEAETLAGSRVRRVSRTADLVDMAVPQGPLWVHVDVDVITAAEAPAQNYPAPGGPTAAETAAVMAHLAASGRVVAASMSTWNPELDLDGVSATVCMAAFEPLIH